VTDWGDGGHWQPLAVSFLPWAAAAEHAWRGEEAADNDAILRACALQVFGDPSARFTRAAARLGDVHERVGAPVHNAAVLFRLLSPRPDERLLAGITAEALAGAEAELRDLRAELSLAPCARPDAGLIREELDFAARGLLLGCARARALLDRRAPPGFDAELAAWMDTHRRLWLARHRPGGLADSLARMAALRAET
jgi:hypothetical protein